MSVQNEDVQFSLTLPITLRKLREADLPGLEWNGEFTHFRNVFRRSFNDQSEGRRYLLVADCNNFPIGRLFILFQSRNLQIADGYTRAYLYSFAVMPMFRGNGIGSRMILEAESLLKQWHYDFATIAVARDNEGALRLYRRHDYTVFGEDDGRWRYTDHKGVVRHVYEPCWLLEKDLITKI